MSCLEFGELLQFIVKSSKRRPTISPAEHLMNTLRYLATGMVYSQLLQAIVLAQQLFSTSLRVIWTVLGKKDYESGPKTQEKWLEIVQEFNRQWKQLIGKMLPHKHPVTVDPHISTTERL